MGRKDNLTVEDILSTNEWQISSGEIVTGREYLDSAINAFGLQSCDYNTAFRLLIWMAKGHNGETIAKEIKDFWRSLEAKYK